MDFHIKVGINRAFVFVYGAVYGKVKDGMSFYESDPIESIGVGVI
jgi:hypothetical protein